MPVYPTFGIPVAGTARPTQVNPRLKVLGPAQAGAVVPYERSQGGGFVRVRGATAPAKPTFTMPEYPPAGTFNPSREIESLEAGRGLSQTLGNIDTSEDRARTDYAEGMKEYDRQTGEENSGYERALKLLSDAFTRLGGQQTERANASGLLQGGALLQAATKRAANEGVQKETDRIAHEKALGGIDRARAKLIQELVPPDTANPLGGRKWQDWENERRNLSGNTAFFQANTRQLAAAEAAPAGWGGYTSSAAAPAHRAAAPARRLWNPHTKRMETYAHGKWGG